ncbi:MAG: hypothetical protein KAT85_04600 [candidate division Zixibacteria bacterium]|nr:hypothetical protein [candidate division Zixibacteria bacterium]
MRTTALILMIALLSTSSGKSEVELSGYFEPQYSASYVDDTLLQLNSNKLRLDLSSDLSDGITFTGNVNYLNYNGRTAWNFLDFIPERLRVTARPSLWRFSEFGYEDLIKLDNAYLRMYHKALTATIGRQQISVGSGYAWNPTDLFNTKNILDPTYEQPGVNGLRLDIGLSNDHTVSVFYSPEDNWYQSGKLLRFLGRISHFDFALSAGRKQQEITDYNTLMHTSERRDMLGFDLNGEILGVGCWTENARNFMRKSSDYWENLAGIDYTFSSGWYVMAEYYHNGRGKKDYDRYTLYDWMRYFTLETKTLARDQAYLYSIYPVTDLINAGASIVCAISDNSMLLIPTAEYSITNNLTCTLFGNIYIDSEGKMYSRLLGNGGMIRLQAYF